MRHQELSGSSVISFATTAIIASTTAAADLLGVGRSALSNLLNGHADLWPEMALRIEKAFGVRMDTLLAMQLAHDMAEVRRRSSEIRVRRFRPVET